VLSFSLVVAAAVCVSVCVRVAGLRVRVCVSVLSRGLLRCVGLLDDGVSERVCESVGEWRERAAWRERPLALRECTHSRSLSRSCVAPRPSVLLRVLTRIRDSRACGAASPTRWSCIPTRRLSLPASSRAIALDSSLDLDDTMATREKDKKDVVIGCATYEGETKNGMKHGMGTLTWDDGDQVRSGDSERVRAPSRRTFAPPDATTMATMATMVARAGLLDVLVVCGRVPQRREDARHIPMARWRHLHGRVEEQPHARPRYIHIQESTHLRGRLGRWLQARLWHLHLADRRPIRGRVRQRPVPWYVVLSLSLAERVLLLYPTALMH